MLNTPKPKVRFQRKKAKFINGKLVISLKTSSFKTVSKMYVTQSNQENISALGAEMTRGFHVRQKV